MVLELYIYNEEQGNDIGWAMKSESAEFSTLGKQLIK